MTNKVLGAIGGAIGVAILAGMIGFFAGGWIFAVIGGLVGAVVGGLGGFGAVRAYQKYNEKKIHSEMSQSEVKKNENENTSDHELQRQSPEKIQVSSELEQSSADKRNSAKTYSEDEEYSGVSKETEESETSYAEDEEDYEEDEEDYEYEYEEDSNSEEEHSAQQQNETKKITINANDLYFGSLSDDEKVSKKSSLEERRCQKLAQYLQKNRDVNVVDLCDMKLEAVNTPRKK